MADSWEVGQAVGGTCGVACQGVQTLVAACHGLAYLLVGIHRVAGHHTVGGSQTLQGVGQGGQVHREGLHPGGLQCRDLGLLAWSLTHPL